ncbi:MAG: peroxiredoxin [Bacteroidota bacterium]
MQKLSTGSQAPDFSLKNQDNKMISLTDFKGKKWVVLYFYPKDETPGCVAEACAFRDSYEVFVDNGAEVIGVSSDSTSSHLAFSQKRKLPFNLLSDRGQKVRKLYGVSSSLFGLLPGRETFVIDPEGIVQMRFASQMNIDGHIQKALEVIQEKKKPA